MNASMKRNELPPSFSFFARLAALLQLFATHDKSLCQAPDIFIIQWSLKSVVPVTRRSTLEQRNDFMYSQASKSSVKLRGQVGKVLGFFL